MSYLSTRTAAPPLPQGSRWQPTRLTENGASGFIVSPGLLALEDINVSKPLPRTYLRTYLPFRGEPHHSHANPGKVLSTIHLPEGKMAGVQELLRKRGISSRQCAGLGDSPHDEPLLASVGFPIALNAKEGMERIAKERGWPSLTHENVLEYVQKWMDATR